MGRCSEVAGMDLSIKGNATEDILFNISNSWLPLPWAETQRLLMAIFEKVCELQSKQEPFYKEKEKPAEKGTR